MLKSLKIKNFKNIKNLEIVKLSKVNLITGKNNTSKTSLLEAVLLLASDMDFNWIYSLIRERGELYYTDNNNSSIPSKSINNLLSLKSLFHSRLIDFEGGNPIFISSDKDFVGLDFIHFIEETDKIDDNGRTVVRSRTRTRVNNLLDFPDSFIGLEVKTSTNTIIVPEDRYSRFSQFTSSQLKKNIQFVKPTFQDNENNGILWDKIALTEKEDFVIEALQIIDKNIEKIAFIKDENNRNSREERRVTAKVRGTTDRIPLKSMGDGINRVLSIILGLVNADKGYFFVDEFENGLHYSVQQDLWKIIFELANKLDIQVFVTTHSEDCIKAFSEIVNLTKYNKQGQLFRLDRKNDEIRVVSYESDELKIASENDIETR
ncbi:AAA family ATPase [Arcicella sp. DC2W]|uniref:AAA family ATPase n=1 Tax=Arcicella gelida TaxID=2984195 RepID=A0ABU5S3Z4_9BACT|nr:AAA family ATPase [Arcicella sp. DC2W]MEA5403130.1 AAA family ATPase [Arcicella sp. DC2W]